MLDIYTKISDKRDTCADDMQISDIAQLTKREYKIYRKMLTKIGPAKSSKRLDAETDFITHVLNSPRLYTLEANMSTDMIRSEGRTEAVKAAINLIYNIYKGV